MTLLLRILAYLAVGFGVAVLAVRYAEFPNTDAGDAWCGILGWPVIVAVLLSAGLVAPHDFIRWCARRLP